MVPSPALLGFIVAAGAALAGCASGPNAARESPGIVPASDALREETRAERYARGEYRRGFGRDAARQSELCRLKPADPDCFGRRF